MKRTIEKQLVAWKNSPRRKPLVLKGARQVGKTWALKNFGATQYAHTAYISLEKIAPGISSEFAQFFEQTNDPYRIVQSLELATGIPIVPNETLLVLDEIQDCPAAIASLKQFCEKASEFHVACAGSLLGVALANEAQAFPVGKVTFLDMHPLSFNEYLDAVGANNLSTFAAQVESLEPVPDLFANQFTEHLQRFFAVGGMPESVDAWAQTQQLDDARKVQADLLDSYDRDFNKHGGGANYFKISQIWNSLPAQLAKENKKFVYNKVNKSARAREYQDSLSWLVNAGLVCRVLRSSGPALPLSSNDEQSAFKLYNLDVGLLRQQAQLDPTAFGMKDNLFAQFKGAFAENFALQELLQQADQTPRYWAIDNPHYEVDFLIQVQNTIVPIEVKAGENVKSASLRKYGEKFADETPLRVRLSLRNLALDGDVLNIPLFLAGQTVRLIELALKEVL